MIFKTGARYLFMTQRYAYSGTVEHCTPTHVVLGTDAEIHYDDIGYLDDFIRGQRKGKSAKVPGQVVSTLGTDATPLPDAALLQ